MSDSMPEVESAIQPAERIPGKLTESEKKVLLSSLQAGDTLYSIVNYPRLASTSFSSSYQPSMETINHQANQIRERTPEVEALLKGWGIARQAVDDAYLTGFESDIHPRQFRNNLNLPMLNIFYLGKDKGVGAVRKFNQDLHLPVAGSTSTLDANHIRVKSKGLAH